MSTQFDDLIWKAGQTHSVDPLLIKAVVWAESNFDPRAYRYEPHIQDASYGLMQTLFNTARSMGYVGPPDGLFVPSTSIEYGTRYLKKQIVRYGGNMPAAVAAYNAGSARVVNGRFTNQKYVDRVMNRYEQYKQIAGAGEQDSTIMLRTAAPQMGPLPSSPPVRLETYQNGEEVGAAIETFLTSQYGPYILALGGGLLLATIFGPRRG